MLVKLSMTFILQAHYKENPRVCWGLGHGIICRFSLKKWRIY